MSAGNIFAGILFLVYGFLFVQALPGKRQGWVFTSISSTAGPVFHAAMANDFIATIIYFWLTFVQQSTLIGRSTILWMAHFALTGTILGKFINDEGGSYGCFARPVLLAFGLYWYYLAAGPGVSLTEIFETLEEFLDA